MKNYHIAKTHRLYRKFVGHVVAQSALLAFIANTVVVPCGLVVLSIGMKANWFACCVVFFIGCLLALIADGMTLSACARRRKAVESLKTIEGRYAIIPDREKKQPIIDKQKKEEAEMVKLRSLNTTFIVFFSLVSASAGDIFWHKLLESLPSVEGWIFSTLFSVLISGTLIASEMFKDQNNEVVRDAILCDHFVKEAILEDANEQAMKKLADKASKKIDTIADNERIIDVAIEQHMENVYDRLLGDGKGLLPARLKIDRKEREIALLKEQEESQRQLDIINGRNTDSLPIVEQTQEQTNYDRVSLLYTMCGENYIRENINDIAMETGLTTRTIYRYLSRLRKESVTESV